MAGGFPTHWQRLDAVSAALVPLSWVFTLAAAMRRALYRARLMPSRRLPVPVVVIGNRVAGGTGKTPLVLALVENLGEAGYRPGIVSRGYGGTRSSAGPVHAHDDPLQAGDEAVLLAQRSGCPVWTGADRAEAARALLARHPDCNVIVCDDGLQHYRLQRDLEIAVEDSRGHGNGLRMPAGPLREAADRPVDALVVNGEPHPARRAALGRERHCFRMDLEPEGIYALERPEMPVEPSELQGKRLHAIAGIGDPARFFRQLKAMGLEATGHAFADHHRFTSSDLRFEGAQAVLMTEKDAVKCSRFRNGASYALRVRARIDPAFFEFVRARLRAIPRGT